MGDETVTGKEEREIPKCPSCGLSKVVPIVYGMPGSELIEAYEKGEVELGGCVVSDYDPEWRCRACGHDWGRA